VAAVTPSQVRPRREREEEVLVWPDLVFVEFIAAATFTFSFTVLSALMNAPLINRANPDVTPNPSKAPWYFLNLQELLLHMNPALAGVIVPTVLLIILAAVPYYDRSKEGQGSWFATANSVRIAIWSVIVAVIGTGILVLFDSSKHVRFWQDRWEIAGITFKPSFGTWPVGSARPHWLPHSGLLFAIWDLVFVRNVRAIQTEWKWSIPVGGLQPGKGPHDGRLDWPQDFTHIPIPLINGTSWPWHWGGQSGQPPPEWYRHLPGWLTGLYPYDLNWNFPAFIVEQLIPVTLMVGLPVLLLYGLWRIGWLRTRRDICIAIFSGFIAVYFFMTIVGAAFRGSGQDLVYPWDVPHIDG
jgi:quinol---cytochrome c reductase cytochrome c subunit, bacillus type